MNLALATLSILTLLAPGFFFRRFYYTNEFSKQYFKLNFSDLVFATLIPAVLIHMLAYNLFILNSKYSIDVSVLAVLFGGTNNANDITQAFTNIYMHCSPIISYLIGTCIIGGTTGGMLKFIIRKTKLDRKSKFFRFRNQWHYIFSGEILDFENIPGSSKEVDLVSIEALVQLSEGTVVYSGWLSDYVLSKNGGLDRIYLQEVKRRYINDDYSENEYVMEGKFFILPFDKILNLHILYYNIEIIEDLQPEIEETEIN